MLVVQKLMPLVQHIAGAHQKITVRKLTVLPTQHAGEAEGFARKAISVNEQLRAATGVDLGQVVRRLSAPQPPPPPKPEE